MKLTTEELAFIFNLGKESVHVLRNAYEPVQYGEKLHPLPRTGSDKIFLDYAISALDTICKRSKCSTCILYEGSSKACGRNVLIQRTRIAEHKVPEAEQ